jgi:pSer/pThr/pTyr-binding forkhead associated (FHA) protein
MQYVIRDVGSSNGTFVNETRLEEGSAHILKPNDQVRFGKVKYVFRVLSASTVEGNLAPLRSESLPGLTKLQGLTTGFFDPDAGGQALPPSGQPVRMADGSLMLPGATQALPSDIVDTFKESPALIVMTHDSPQVFSLKHGKRITIGRDKKCDIALAEVTASRKHAEVFPGPEGFYIRDLGSSNGVIVNQLKIDNPYLLVHADRILIGGIVIFFLDIRQKETVGAGIARALNTGGALLAPALNAPCSNCGASNLSIARFCATCGTPLETPNAAYNG